MNLAGRKAIFGIASRQSNSTPEKHRVNKTNLLFRFVFMEKVTHIYVYGDIINYQSSEADDYGFVSLTSVMNQFNKNPDCEEIVVHVHSCGGDVYEGFAIYDFLSNTGKKVTTIVEGLCASIATVIFLAGSVRQLTENSRFLIHNPWTFTDGNADELEAVAAALRLEQQKMLNFYVEKTAGDADALQLLMNEDKVIDADEALQLGFATEIIGTVSEVVASVRNVAHQKLIVFNLLKNNKIKMKVENKTKLKGLIAQTKTLLKAFAGVDDDANPVASSVELSDGEKLYFAEDTIAVGVAVFSDEAMTTPAPDGEYTDASEGVIVVTDNAVESITPKAEASAESDAEIIARLTTERDNALALAGENETLALALGESLQTLQAASNKFKTSFKPAARATDTNTSAASGKKKVVVEAKQGSLKEEMKAFKEARKEAAKK